MARVPFPNPEDMTPDQRAVYDKIVSGPRGTVIGPLRAAIHSPELAERWSDLGEYLRFRMCVPKRQKELAIIVTGRRWTAQVEWWVHAAAGAAAGLPETVLDAIREGKPPAFEDPDDAAVYEFARQLHDGEVDKPAYEAIRSRWGDPGVVELTALIGYYTMVSMTLNAHEIDVPDGVEPPLKPLAGKRLARIPAAQSRSS